MDSGSVIVESPVADEGKQSENQDLNAATAVESSPLPTRPRHGNSLSLARKRTNEEIYEPVDQPKSSPTATRFQKSVATSMPSDLEAQQITATPFERHGFAVLDPPGQSLLRRRGELIPENDRLSKSSQSNPSTSNDTFAKEIQDYQQQLDREFQEFEQSLNERDTSVNLDTLDWNELEDRYSKEVRPNLDAENEILKELGARFEVRPTT